MAWNPHPKVADCREIARKWSKQQVIIIAVDLVAHTMEYASYGETKELCAQARRFGDKAYDAVMKQATTELLSSPPKRLTHQKAVELAERMADDEADSILTNFPPP